MKEVEHRVAPRGVFRVTGRQIHDHRAIGRIAFEIAFERAAVDGEAFERAFRRRRLLRRWRGRDDTNARGDEGDSQWRAEEMTDVMRGHSGYFSLIASEAAPHTVE